MILFLYILYQFINKLHLSFFRKTNKRTNIFHSIKNSHVFFYTFAHKIGGTSAIQANLIAFGLHNLCIREHTTNSARSPTRTPHHERTQTSRKSSARLSYSLCPIRRDVSERPETHTRHGCHLKQGATHPHPPAMPFATRKRLGEFYGKRNCLCPNTHHPRGCRKRGSTF